MPWWVSHAPIEASALANDAACRGRNALTSLAAAAKSTPSAPSTTMSSASATTATRIGGNRLRKRKVTTGEDDAATIIPSRTGTSRSRASFRPAKMTTIEASAVSVVHRLDFTSDVDATLAPEPFRR